MYLLLKKLLLLCFVCSALPSIADPISYKNSQHSSLTTLLASKETPEEQLEFLRSLEKNLPGKTLDERAQYWFLLGTVLEKNKQLQQAKHAFTQTIEMLQTQENVLQTSLLIKALIERSYIKYLQSNDSKQYCADRKRAYGLVSPNLSPELQVRTRVQYAFCFQLDKSLFSTALALLNDALDIAKDHKLTANTHAMIYNASGNVYIANQLFDKAHTYLNNAYKQWKSVNDYTDMFNMLHSLTDINIQRMQFELAQSYVDEMFSMAKQHKRYEDFLFFAHYNAGLLDLARSNIHGAIEHYTQAISLEQTTQETFFVKRAYQYLIESHYRIGQDKEAYTTLQNFYHNFPTEQIKNGIAQAFAMSQSTSDKNERYLLLAQIDKEKKTRRQFVKNASQASSSLHSKNMLSLDKRVLEQTVTIQQLQLKAQEADKQNVYLILFFGAFLLVCLIVFSFYLFKTRQYFIYHARTDYLTKVFNRRFTFEKGKQLITKAHYAKQHLHLMLFDIDHFKQINDTLGHHVGDLAIKHVVSICQENIKPTDHIGRLGGDEFIILLPTIEQQQVRDIAENIRQTVASSKLEALADVPLTLSIGIIDCTNHTTLNDALVAADILLYQAKSKGRNIVVSE